MIIAITACIRKHSSKEKNDVILVLKTILEVKEKFKADHIASILAGIKTSAIKSYNHQMLDNFGAGNIRTLISGAWWSGKH